MKANEIRSVFLDYFAGHGHEIVPSSSLVPHNDPTLLFVNSGMVQFKDVFLGLDRRPYRRATTAQRCVRAGGKHNDLENVGYTGRHHTFFEMLGNFSFGDYFKREAIHYAWDLLTRGYGLPAERLWVTVYVDDDEAADIWLKEIGVDEDRFRRIAGSDNFWAMGDTGPCGPCTEVFYDHGPSVAGGPPGSPDADGDRYVEIWNLVFMQFNRDAEGTLHPLPKPSVDTGMGLERLATVLQGVHSNYDIDLFSALIDAAQAGLGVADRESKSLRVIADHIRSCSFLLVDGVTPSNEGRGYVLRRILRRAIRHGYLLGAREPFFHGLVGPLAEQMGDAYPELREARERVERTIRLEEERFAETLENGLHILDQAIARLDGDTIPGDVAFRLYDTYGFPADLTADVAREHGLEVDMAGFEQAMEAQRERARAAGQFTAVQAAVNTERDTQFCGYAGTRDRAEVVALVREGREVDVLEAGQEGIVVLERTPFYAESGGQVGDRGQLRGGEAVFDVADTRYLGGRVIGHVGRVRMGSLRRGDALDAEVDADRRTATMYNHSATHLLHAALREILGRHVEQKGSLVEPARLRFDFTHPEPMTPEQIAAVERRVNEEIRRNSEVETRVMPIEQARTAGAVALFGEKYDEEVRVVGMGDFSLELCGGTHVHRTGDIGVFRIVAESGIAAGVRRIEAVTAEGALAWIDRQLASLDSVAARLRAGRDEVPDKVAQLVERARRLEREVESLRARLASGGGNDLAAQAQEVAGVRVLAASLDGADPRSLRQAVDNLKERLGSAVVVLGARSDDKVALIAGVTDDLVDRVNAGRLMQEIAAAVDGRGGGRADMAQGGGSAPDRLDEALSRVAPWVRQALGA